MFLLPKHFLSKLPLWVCSPVLGHKRYILRLMEGAEQVDKVIRVVEATIILAVTPAAQVAAQVELDLMLPATIRGRRVRVVQVLPTIFPVP